MSPTPPAPVSPKPRAPFWSPRRLATALSACAGMAVLLTLGDPGLTTDEPLDVRPGRIYVATLRAEGWRFFDRAVVDRVFADNKEHPPLGRWLLGVASTLGEPFEILRFGPDPLGLYAHSGRVAPALAFAVLVGLVANETGRRYGRAGGVAAGLGLGFMPRVFAHAHFGALDTFLCLFWTAALLSADRALAARRPLLAMTGAGGLFALALLTKIHAWFLIPVVGAWAFVRLRPTRAGAALAVWLTTGVGLFLLGWPWLWYDTLPRLSQFFRTGVDRTAIYVQYFGRVYADKDVPWHYPWFYFAITVPVGLHLFGLLGLVQGVRERRKDLFALLLAGAIGLFLVIFSTRAPVYDGERLFLLVFPLWAVLIGGGFGWAWEQVRDRRQARFGLAAVFLVQGWGVIALHPFQLSFYNVLVGGLPGAERIGLELTYWGDAVDRVLLDRLAASVPSGSPAALAPTLYPGQGVLTTTRRMARRGVILQDEDAVIGARWLVVSRRSAYWKPDLQRLLRTQGRCVFVRSRRGVWLSGIWEIPKP